MTDFIVPLLSEKELGLLSRTSKADIFRVDWATRLIFPGKKKPYDLVVAWCRAGYIAKDGAFPADTNWWSGWRCTFCKNIKEDCLHARTARQLLIYEIREEALRLFPGPNENRFWTETYPWKLDAETGADVVWWYWNEVMADERPMGQIRQKTVWTMTLVEVLDIKFKQHSKFNEIFKILAERRQLTLDGTIVCSYERRMEEFKELEKATGHRELHRNDFGSWACHYCRKTGDEYAPAAVTVPCIREDTNTTNEWIEIKAEDNDDNNK